jgi:hypothetical protein
MAIANFQFSVTNGDSTVNIETITEYPPLATPVGFPLTVEAASGQVFERGGRVCEWRFRALTETEFDALRTLIPGKSITCWIRTIEEDKDDYAYYTGIVIWPGPEEIERPISPKYVTGEFPLRFRNLIPYTPTP